MTLSGMFFIIIASCIRCIAAGRTYSPPELAPETYDAYKADKECIVLASIISERENQPVLAIASITVASIAVLLTVCFICMFKRIERCGRCPSMLFFILIGTCMMFTYILAIAIFYGRDDKESHIRDTLDRIGDVDEALRDCGVHEHDVEFLRNRSNLVIPLIASALIIFSVNVGTIIAFVLWLRRRSAVA